MHKAIVIGGGQSGLASAYALRQHGFAPLLLEAAEEAVGSWPHYYDSLVLFTVRQLNALPGMPFPGEPREYPTRDEVVAYLRSYAAWLDCEIRTGQRVTSVLCGGDGYEVTTESGETHTAPVVVAASGNFGRPHLPDLGLGSYTGTVLHSSAYRRPEPFAGQRVVVVGGGSSAVQIAVELAEHARVSLAARRPPRVRRWRYGGNAAVLAAVEGVGRVPLGKQATSLQSRKGEVVPDVTGKHLRALARGEPDQPGMFLRGEGDELVWPRGGRERVDAVVLATGYRPSLGYLRPLGAVDRNGMPRHRGGLSTTHPGLAFVGLVGQRALYTGAIGGVGWDACYVARQLSAAVAARTPDCCGRSPLRRLRTAARRGRLPV